jgi:hypothetical protein
MTNSMFRPASGHTQYEIVVDGVERVIVRSARRRAPDERPNLEHRDVIRELLGAEPVAGEINTYSGLPTIRGPESWPRT